MAKTKIGSNATFSGTQKGLTVLGDHCMGYSGVTAIANTEIFCLNFFSPGKRYIIAQGQIGSKDAEGEDYVLKIYFNNIVVFSHIFHQQGSTYVDIPNSIPLMIPPATEVKISLQNIANTNSRDWTVHLVGKVYA